MIIGINLEDLEQYKLLPVYGYKGTHLF